MLAAGQIDDLRYAFKAILEQTRQGKTPLVAFDIKPENSRYGRELIGLLAHHGLIFASKSGVGWLASQFAGQRGEEEQFEKAFGQPLDSLARDVVGLNQKPATTSKENRMASTKTAKSTKTTAAPKAPKAPNLCYCGCKTQISSKSTFAQGHDARYISNLVADSVTGNGVKVAGEHVDGAIDIQERINQVTKLVEKHVSTPLANKYHQAAMNAWDKAVKQQAPKAPRAARASKPKAAKVVRAKVGRWTVEGVVTADGFAYQTKAGESKLASKYELV